MEPTKLRQQRQQQHLNNLSKSLIDGSADESLINQKALQRYLEFSGYLKEELYEDCREDKVLSNAIAFAVCKNATRQGIKDEELVLEHINSMVEHCTVSNLSVNGKRYDKIDKSVDGEITGKINGDIFAKIIVGKGGHQDNVWIELNSIIDEVKKLPKDRIYCLLVDTDNINNFLKLREKQTNNIWVCDTPELIEKLN